MNMIADVVAAADLAGWGRSRPRLAGSEPPACTAATPVKPSKRRGYRPFSQNDDIAIMAGVAAGKRFQDIATEIGRGPGSVYTRYRLLESTGFHYDRDARRVSLAWSFDEDDLLFRLHSDGWTYRAIQREHMPNRTIEAMRMRFSLLKRGPKADDAPPEPFRFDEDYEERWLENAKAANAMMIERLAAYFARGGGI